MSEMTSHDGKDRPKVRPAGPPQDWIEEKGLLPTSIDPDAAQIDQVRKLPRQRQPVSYPTAAQNHLTDLDIWPGGVC